MVLRWLSGTRYRFLEELNMRLYCHLAELHCIFAWSVEEDERRHGRGNWKSINPFRALLCANNICLRTKKYCFHAKNVVCAQRNIVFAQSNIIYTQRILFLCKEHCFHAKKYCFCAKKYCFHAKSIVFAQRNIVSVQRNIVFTQGNIVFTQGNIVFPTVILPFLFTQRSTRSGRSEILRFTAFRNPGCSPMLTLFILYLAWSCCI